MPDTKDAMKIPVPGPAAGSDAAKAPSGAAGQPNTLGKPGASAHRSSTAKEVIPFEWKLIGESEGFALTLFKSIEREDVDAQFERVQRDGYYLNLRILGADDKVKQPTSTKARRERQTAKVTKEVEQAVKARLEAEAMAKSAKATKKTPAPKASKTPSKFKAAKSAKPKAKAKARVKPKAKAKSKAKPKVEAKSKPAKKSAAAKSKSKAKAKPKAKTADKAKTDEDKAPG